MNEKLVYRVDYYIENFDSKGNDCEGYQDFETVEEAIKRYKKWLTSSINKSVKFEVSISYGKDNGMFLSFDSHSYIASAIYHGSIPYFEIFELEDEMKKELDMFHKSMYLKLFKNYEGASLIMKREIDSWGVTPELKD